MQPCALAVHWLGKICHGVEVHAVVAGIAFADVRLVDCYVLGQLGASSAVYFTKRHQDDVTLIAPDLFPHLAAHVAQMWHKCGTNVAQALHAISCASQRPLPNIRVDLSISGSSRCWPWCWPWLGWPCFLRAKRECQQVRLCEV